MKKMYTIRPNFLLSDSTDIKLLCQNAGDLSTHLSVIPFSVADQ